MRKFLRRNLAETLFIIAALAILVLAFSPRAHAADTYTPDLRIVQMPTGSNDTLWGIKANAAFAMLEQGIAGGATISVTSGSVTLTTANNASDQARNAVLAFTGTPGVTRTVTMPNVSKLTWVVNASNAAITFNAGAGLTSTVGSGNVALIYTDGSTNANLLTNISNFSAVLLAASTQADQRTALGLGSSATHPATDFMQGANNLSEITSAATARTTLGLGTSSVLNVLGTQTRVATVVAAPTTGNFASFDATGSLADSTKSASSFMVGSNNGSEFTSVSTVRTTLGLKNGALATITASTGDPSGTPADNDIWIKY